MLCYVTWPTYTHSVVSDGCKQGQVVLLIARCVVIHIHPISAEETDEGDVVSAGEADGFFVGRAS